MDPVVGKMDAALLDRFIKGLEAYARLEAAQPYPWMWRALRMRFPRRNGLTLQEPK